MPDVMQQGVQAFAYAGTVTRDLAIFCGTLLVFVLAAAWLLVLAAQRARLTFAMAVRIALLLVVAYLAAKVLSHVILDPRPYLVDHVTPLAHVSRDNGFPSDHTLLAAALTASLMWIARRWIAVFALGTLLVMLGRLGIGAHHTIDVLGSVAIVVVVALVVAAFALPAAWNTPLLARRLPGRAGGTAGPRPRGADRR